MAIHMDVRRIVRGLSVPMPVRTLLVNAVSIGIVVTLLLFLTATLWRVLFNDPPIELTSRDPITLGKVCPAEQHPVRLRVQINDEVVMHLYVQVMDGTGTLPLLGTQITFLNWQHPRPTVYETELPWEVPALPAGRYRRTTGARNVSGSQNTVWVETFFEIPGAGGCASPALSE